MSDDDGGGTIVTHGEVPEVGQGRPVAALRPGLATACAALLPVAALALVPAEEAAKLKTTLTPLGAERAGNPEGTIPAWTGGATEAPAGYKSGEPRPDPFDLRLSVRRPTGRREAIDLRTLPFVRFDRNEAHHIGTYGLNLGQDSGGSVGP